MRTSIAAFVLAALPVSPLALAKQCTLDGEDVNPDNGATMAGRTGLLVCLHDDGRKMYEHEYRNGEHIGLERTWGFDGGMTERQVNASGNSEGPARELYPDGTVKLEATYRDGDAIGLSRSFHENARLAALRFHETAGERAAVTIEFDDTGALSGLACGTRSYIPEDRAVCGFDGRQVEVSLHRRGKVAGKRVLRDGRVLRMDSLDDAGRLVESSQTTANGRITRRWYESGQKAAEAIVADDRVVSESEWYMNGAPKSKTTIDPKDERNPRIVSERYRDTGKLEQREERVGRRLVRRELFDESGTRSEEFVHADEGHVKLHRKFAPDGSIVLEEEMFPDGSRKVIRGPG